MQQYDLVVIGAGPAGSSAAEAAAHRGLNVLMLDKRAAIGEPVVCGEFIPRALLREIPGTKDMVSQRITTIETLYPSGRSVSLHAPGVILDRDRFDRALAARAIYHGARLRLKCRALNIDGKELLIRENGGEKVITGRIYIAADGPDSIIRRRVYSESFRFLHAMQYRVPLRKRSDVAQVIFRHTWTGGYGWLFPKGDIANIGLGMVRSRSGGQLIRQFLDEFVAEFADRGVISGQPLSVVRGKIPVSGPLPHCVSGNIMFVGDAAGQTHAITGGGIPQAVICGRLAGLAAAKAVKTGDIPGALHNYDAQWKRRFLTELRRAASRRSELDRSWSDLEAALDRCWISSRGYYS